MANLTGDYLDLRGHEKDLPTIFATDSYADSQPYGEAARTAGEAGIIYSSIRKVSGLNVVAYRPSLIQNVRQAEHFEISVQAKDRRINVHALTAAH